MRKCDFCSYGYEGEMGYCPRQGYYECEEAAERFFKFCISKNNRTINHNKNVNIKKRTNKQTYNKRKY